MYISSDIDLSILNKDNVIIWEKKAIIVSITVINKVIIYKFYLDNNISFDLTKWLIGSISDWQLEITK